MTKHCSQDRLWRLQVREITYDNLTPGHCCCGCLLLPLPPSQGGEAAGLWALQLLQLAGSPETCHCCSPLHRAAKALEKAGRTTQLSAWSTLASPLTGNHWFRIGCQCAACGLKVVAYDWGPLPKTQHLLHWGSYESPTLVHTGTIALLMMVIRQLFNE